MSNIYPARSKQLQAMADNTAVCLKVVCNRSIGYDCNAAINWLLFSGRLEEDEVEKFKAVFHRAYQEKHVEQKTPALIGALFACMDTSIVWIDSYERRRERLIKYLEYFAVKNWRVHLAAIWEAFAQTCNAIFVCRKEQDRIDREEDARIEREKREHAHIRQLQMEKERIEKELASLVKPSTPIKTGNSIKRAKQTAKHKRSITIE